MSVEVKADVTGTPESFIDIDVLQDALEYALGNCRPMEIIKVVYDLGSRAGDNYLGQIYRIKLFYRPLGGQNGKVESHSFIAKCIPNSKANEFLHDCQMFLKEELCYREILPRLELLSLEGEKFGARLYNTIKEPIKTLIFEDLQTLHYCMASRQIGLDLPHAGLVLQKLGKFHAMSMLLDKMCPHLKNCLHSGLVSETMLKEDGMPLPYYGTLIASLEARVRTWIGYNSIAEKIHKFRQNFRDNLMKLVAPQPNDINVMNHGDLWVNNALFKYSDTDRKKPQDVIFVDFQMTIWGSLGLDINYFFNTSVQLDILKTQRLRLLRIYYDSLSSTLTKHQQQIQHKHIRVPNFSQVLHEVEKREPWGFFAAFAILPLISLDKELAGDSCVDNLVDEEFARKKIELMFETKKVQDILKYSLRRFDELGVFG